MISQFHSEYSARLAALKVGDSISVSQGNDLWGTARISQYTITRLTAMQIVCGDRRFHRKDGRALPRQKWGRRFPEIVFLDSDDLAAQLEAKDLQFVVGRLSRENLKNYPLSSGLIGTIAQLLRGHDAEQLPIESAKMSTSEHVAPRL